MGRIMDMVSEERPRERLWKQGASSLKVSELLAILIRTGTKGKSAVLIAEEMMARYQSLDNLGKVSAQEIAKIKGLGMTKAVQLKAAFELGARLSRSRALHLPVATPQDVQLLLGEEMRQLPYESLRVIAVNTRLKLLAAEELSRGTINETVAHPRDVLRVALLHQAYGIVVVHNHPAGDCAPSQADLTFTLRVRDAAKLMQIIFLDHIILASTDGTEKGYYSFKEAGYL
jgi:DNA repair protein RadC